MRSFRWFLCVLVLSSSICWAQSPEEDYRTTLLTSKRGMWALTSWAGVNMASSAVLSFTTEGSQRYFHQMNGIWNTVNLGIGIVGLVQTKKALRKMDVTLYPANPMKSKKAFAINGFVDILYMGSGAMLWALKDRFANPDIPEGYGQSIVLQGAFLFAFDWVMYGRLNRTLKRSRPTLLD